MKDPWDKYRLTGQEELLHEKRLGRTTTETIKVKDLTAAVEAIFAPFKALAKLFQRNREEE